MDDIDIEVAKDYVIIEGSRIERPTRMSPSRWLDFWDRMMVGGAEAVEEEDEDKPEEK